MPKLYVALQPANRYHVHTSQLPLCALQPQTVHQRKLLDARVECPLYLRRFKEIHRVPDRNALEHP